MSVLKLLKKLLIRGETRFESTALLQLLSVGETKRLVVTAPFVYNLASDDWTKINYKNIIFIHLETQTVEFVVYNADLLISCTASREANKLKQVLFLREK